MTDVTHLMTLLTVLVLAVFVGFEVISKVPTTLHTPLMSATNAIHGVVIVGAIVVVANLFGVQGNNPLLTTLAIIMVTLGAINVFGGFAVTERMLQMFRRKESK
ncbi:MAG TPA: NAD(P) transhydrogenase subunit alpha [Candidatus Dormibacteraeota bacterium]|nr:NAD(P) transhydrogenase subunit alpha [Candidatus Dormibacteraeota bacterium]